MITPERKEQLINMSLDKVCHDIRKKIKDIRDEVDVLFKEQTAQLMVMSDRSEVYANLKLAFRHLEDAGMRLGKSIQAYDGGASVRDKGED